MFVLYYNIIELIIISFVPRPPTVLQGGRGTPGQTGILYFIIINLLFSIKHFIINYQQNFIKFY